MYRNRNWSVQTVDDPISCVSPAVLNAQRIISPCLLLKDPFLPSHLVGRSVTVHIFSNDTHKRPENEICCEPKEKRALKGPADVTGRGNIRPSWYCCFRFSRFFFFFFNSLFLSLIFSTHWIYGAHRSLQDMTKTVDVRMANFIRHCTLVGQNLSETAASGGSLKGLTQGQNVCFKFLLPCQTIRQQQSSQQHQEWDSCEAFYHNYRWHDESESDLPH